MRVVTFAPSLSATEEDAGGVNAKGFPMTSCYVNSFPAQITVPMVVAVYALGGSDYDPVQYIIATSPAGERVSTLQFSWHWDDDPPTPVKFRVFVQYLPLRVESAGTYTIGLYDSMDSTDTEHVFPLAVRKTNRHQPAISGRSPVS
jgi:hypothetical protein